MPQKKKRLVSVHEYDTLLCVLSVFSNFDHHYVHGMQDHIQHVIYLSYVIRIYIVLLFFIILEVRNIIFMREMRNILFILGACTNFAIFFHHTYLRLGDQN